jgi:hypothetical protein
VTADRISIADGAFFKGDIDLRKGQPKPMEPVVPVRARASAVA